MIISTSRQRRRRDKFARRWIQPDSAAPARTTVPVANADARQNLAATFIFMLILLLFPGRFQVLIEAFKLVVAAITHGTKNTSQSGIEFNPATLEVTVRRGRRARRNELSTGCHQDSLGSWGTTGHDGQNLTDRAQEHFPAHAAWQTAPLHGGG